jgi:hypothetical protein
MGPKHKARVDLHTVPHRLRVGPNVAVDLALAGFEGRVRRRTPLARIAVGLDEATGLQLVICPVLGQRGQGLWGGLGGGEALSLQGKALLCDGLICTLPSYGVGNPGHEAERVEVGGIRLVREFRVGDHIPWAGGILQGGYYPLGPFLEHLEIRGVAIPTFADKGDSTRASTTEYARRAGLAGTLSQGSQAYGLRHAPYLGGAKTPLQHVLTAAAITWVHIGNWLMKTPLTTTRTSAFQKLSTQPVCC